MRRRSRAERLVALALVGLVCTLAPGAEASQSDSDLREEREALREQRAAMADDIDVSRAESSDLAAALADLEAHVRAEEALLEDAQRAVTAAEAQILEALAAQQRARDEVAEMREAMAQVAVDAYVSPPDQDTLSVMLNGELGTASERRALLDIRASSASDVLERYRAALEDLEIRGEDARAAQERAEEYRSEVDRRLADVAAARDAQALLAGQAQQRLDELLAEEARLQSAERQITNELAERQRQRELAELQRRLAAASRSGPATGPNGEQITLVTVGGITVNSRIASQLQAMLQAAAADGIVLTGGGYRDYNQQVALRRANCGSSNYAIYEMPPNSCRPPTARPSYSMHEQGLAIDFIANGRSISSRSSEGFRWLAANAAQYGFKNLPSEPWHWSTTGG